MPSKDSNPQKSKNRKSKNQKTQSSKHSLSRRSTAMPAKKKGQASGSEQDLEQGSEFSPAGFPRAGFFRRLAAIIYDLLVAVAVGMVAAMLILITLVVLFQTGTLDMGPYEHFSDLVQGSTLYRTIIQSWVGFWVIGFFLWFWRNGGQTIGMRAWRMRLFSTSDEPFTYKRALFRVICSLGGLGTLLVLFDVKNKQSLQDRLAKTEILVLTKTANDHKSWKAIQED